MLRWLRKRQVVKRILWGIAATIVPAFVLWGVGSAVRSGRLSQTIATLDGAKIGVNDYLEHLRAVEQFTRLFGGDAARARPDEERLRAEAWDRTLLLVEAKRRQLTVGDQEVIAYIRSLPFLQRPDGGFDLRTYDYVLRHTLGASPREFEDNVREQLLILKLRQAIVNEATVTDEEAFAHYVAERQPLRVAYALVRSSDIVEHLEPTAEQLRRHYDAHPDRFLVPEQLNLRYVVLPKPPETPMDTAGAPASASASPDEAAEAAADAARQQIAQTRRQAERLVDQILADPSQMAAVAQAAGLTVQETDWFGAGDPIPGLGYERAVADAAWALAVHDVSDPIETDTDFVILQVAERRAARRAPFEEAMDQVREDWRATQQRQIARQRAEALLAQLREVASRHPGAPLEELAAPLGLSVQRTEPIASSGYVSGLGPAALLADAVRTLAVGDVAPSVVGTPVGFAVVQLVERLPVSDTEWEAERETVRQQLLTERRQRHYDDWLDALRQRAIILTEPKEALDEAAEVEEE